MTCIVRASNPAVAFMTSAVCLLASSMGYQAHADYILSGDIKEVNAPVAFSTIVDNDDMLFLKEQSGVSLAAPLSVHFTTTGSFVNATDATPGQISAGTVVSSYYVTNAADAFTSYQGNITFNNGETILAVVGLSTSPGDQGYTDAAEAVFGLAGADYSGRQQGIDLQPAGGADSFTISADRTILTFDFFDATLHDDFRIITVPEPGSATLLLLASPLLRRRRRLE